MADFVLSLGDVDFADFEIPDSIKGGGSQSLEIHKYGGGQRTIDTFGADDDPISWSGLFLDGTAEARCIQIDAMRKAGTPVALSYSSFSYLVVIKSFTWDFEKYYQIPYAITLEVVQDNVQPVTQDDEDDPESSMQGDVDDAGDDADDLGDGDFSSAITTVQNDISSVPSITGGSVPFLGQLSSDVASAGSIVENLSNAADNEMNEVGASVNFASGANPAAMVQNLTAMQASAGELSISFKASNTLTRLGKNVASIISGA